MCRIRLICPGHVEHDLRILVCKLFHFCYKARKIRIGRCKSALGAALLNGYKVPIITLNGGAYFVIVRRRAVPRTAIVIVIFVRRLVACDVVIVRIDNATADNKVSESYLLYSQALRHVVGIRHRIDRKAVSDGKYLKLAVIIPVRLLWLVILYKLAVNEVVYPLFLGSGVFGMIFDVNFICAKSTLAGLAVSAGLAACAVCNREGGRRSVGKGYRIRINKSVGCGLFN